MGDGVALALVRDLSGPWRLRAANAGTVLLMHVRPRGGILQKVKVQHEQMANPNVNCREAVQAVKRQRERCSDEDLMSRQIQCR